jgi:adenine-specific DNA-methyltransferase
MSGVVYTPRRLSTFLVDRLVSEVGSIDEGRWLDPACGDGALLEAIVERLAGDVAPAELADVVQRRVFGVDLDPDVCHQARMRLVRVVERCGGQVATGAFDANILCADFLELDERSGLEPTFIVANPPYVSATQITAAHKFKYSRRFGSAWGRLDLYGLFLEHGLQLLKPGGTLSFVTPDKWLTSASSRPLRALVVARGDVRSIARFDRHDLFPGVATVPCVSVIAKESPSRTTVDVEWYDVDARGSPTARGLRELISLDRRGSPWLPVSEEDADAGVKLGDLAARISVGLATGLNRCFILDDAAAARVEPELLRSVIRGRDIVDGTVRESRHRLLLPYAFDDDGRSTGLVDLADFPKARAHLEAHRAELEQRHCVRVWRKAWYDVHDPVLVDLARQPKIVLPDVAYAPRFALDLGERIPLHSAYYILLRDEAPLSYEDLLEILRSDEVGAELRRRAPTAKSGYRRFRAQALRDLSIPLPHSLVAGQTSLLDAA